MTRKYVLLRDMSFNDTSKNDHSLRILKKGSVYPLVYFNEYDRYSKSMFFQSKKKKENIVILFAEGIQRKFILNIDVRLV